MDVDLQAFNLGFFLIQIIPIGIAALVVRWYALKVVQQYKVLKKKHYGYLNHGSLVLIVLVLGILVYHPLTRTTKVTLVPTDINAQVNQRLETPTAEVKSLAPDVETYKEREQGLDQLRQGNSMDNR